MTADRAYVLDASALLALHYGEPGAAMVEQLVDRASVSAVNWSELCHRHLARGIPLDGLRDDAEALGLRIEPFGVEDAERAAELWPDSRHLGLSLGDRACLALAQRLGVPAVTADRSWRELELDVEIRAIR